MSSKLGPTGVPGKASDSELLDLYDHEDIHGLSEFSEVDFDYDSVNSPGASSTSSEPVYIRKPGFEHHAHAFKATSKNDTTFEDVVRGPAASSFQEGTTSKISSQIHAPPLKEVKSVHGRFFPSPPNTPISLFSPVQNPSHHLHQSSVVEPLKPTCLEGPLKPVSLGPSTSKSQPPPVAPKARTDGDPEKVRTGNHTPPGYSSGKGVKKKKPNASDQSREGTPENARPPGKSKIKREPLPMKMRALPQSFWLQPNKNNNVPPSCSVLPPLIIGKDVSDFIDVVPTSPPTEKEPPKGDREDHRPTERMIKVGNTDLLFRLFDNIEKDDKKKPQVVRRGRPRKAPSVMQLKSDRDEDPCLVSTATESILPLLQDRTPASSGSSTPLGIRQLQGQQVMELVSLKEGDRTVSLPSLSMDHGYSQLLSELVLRL